jgi:hypothetical protein
MYLMVDVVANHMVSQITHATNQEILCIVEGVEFGVVHVSTCAIVALFIQYMSVSVYGTADDLKALAAALHKRDMYLMVDVVANHMVSQTVQVIGGVGDLTHHVVCYDIDHEIHVAFVQSRSERVRRSLSRILAAGYVSIAKQKRNSSKPASLLTNPCGLLRHRP